jgi:hypothetical protein
MDIEFLLQTAKRLQQPSAAAASEFESSRDSLAEELNILMSRRPDLERLIGPDNIEMMQDNSRNFCRFMSTMFTAFEPEVLTQTALWVFRAYRSHGFKTTYWAANLDTFVQIARDQITPDNFKEIYPFFQWLIVNIPVFVQISNDQMADPISPAPDHE